MQSLRDNAPDTALYLRLSRDDGTHTESESIHSQRIFLQQYAAENGFSIAAIYIDDGHSGTNWERPAFQQMLRAIVDGNVRTVLTKDLSRLGRDYIRTGELLERWFPAHRARLIAVNDGVDTARAIPANDFSPIRAVLDDWYARDISRKVRTALYARQKKGICTLARPPYGYQRVGSSLQLMPEEAAVICKIYQYYQEGKSASEIARCLTKQKVETPSGAGYQWNDKSVHRILSNRAYCGQLMLHQFEQISYKCKQVRRLPPDEWHCISVPSVVPIATFTHVQAMLLLRGHRKTRAHWLSGKVFCGLCGSTMTIAQRETIPRAICTGRRRKNGCRNPSLPICEIETALTNECKRIGAVPSDALYAAIVHQMTVGMDTVEIFLHCSNVPEPQISPAVNADNRGWRTVK